MNSEFLSLPSTCLLPSFTELDECGKSTGFSRVCDRIFFRRSDVCADPTAPINRTMPAPSPAAAEEGEEEEKEEEATPATTTTTPTTTTTSTTTPTTTLTTVSTTATVEGGASVDEADDEVLGPISRVQMATSIDFVARDEHIYWVDSDHGSINRIHRDGTQRQVCCFFWIS